MPTTPGPDTVLVIDFPQAGPYVRDTRPATERGIAVDVVRYDDLLGEPRDATVVLNAGDWPLTAQILDRLPRLRYAISYGVGVDWIDLELASSRGVIVVNTPGANAIDVAEHAFALILAGSKRLLEHDRGVRAGTWRPDPPFGLRRLHGRTIGYVAFGNIARQLAARVGPWGMTQIAFDPHVDPGLMRRLDVEPVTWDELAERADIVSVHLPATPETAGFLDAGTLAALRDGVELVITSRGAVYDADALHAALVSGHVATAGLDVFPIEPLPAGHPLAALPNVVLTPHSAAATVDADAAARAAVARSLAAALDGFLPPSAVNPPAGSGPS